MPMAPSGGRLSGNSMSSNINLEHMLKLYLFILPDPEYPADERGTLLDNHIRKKMRTLASADERLY